MNDLVARRSELRLELDRILWRQKLNYSRADAIAKELDTLNVEILVSGIGEKKMYPQPKKLPEYEGPKVLISKRLAQALTMEDRGVRRALATLSEEHRTVVEDEFRKHRAMCAKCGIEPDDRFLRELITDVKSGVHFQEVV